MVEDEMNIFKKFFRVPEPKNEIKLRKIDLSSLDSSLELLQTTTASVANAAAEAAKFLEGKLKDTENRLYSIIDSIDDFVLIKDGEGKWKVMNEFGQGLYGWHNYEYYDKTDYDLMEEYPGLRHHFLQCLSSDIQAWEEKRAMRSEETIILNGITQYFDVIKTPVYNADGSKKELIIVGRNVTQLKSKQKRVKACFTALNSSSDVIVICDGNGDIVFCNDKFLLKFGFTDHHDVIGKKMNIIQSGKTTDETYNDLWKTIKSNHVWSGVITNRTVKGNEVSCKVTILPVMNGVPEPIYYICTMHPISTQVHHQ